MNTEELASATDLERTALVVEDDQIIVKLLEHMLSRNGFGVQIALNGREAVAFMENLSAPPDLILLDVMLPYLDGFELITKIREHATWNEVPVIMLTSK